MIGEVRMVVTPLFGGCILGHPRLRACQEQDFMMIPVYLRKQRKAAAGFACEVHITPTRLGWGLRFTFC